MFVEISNKISKEILSKAIKLFLIVSIPLIILVLFTNQLDRRVEYNDWKKKQESLVTSVKTDIGTYFYSALTDLLVLADNKLLFQGSEKTNTELASYFISLSNISRSYNQLRFINNNGQEVVRVNFKSDDAEIVPFEQLQNKSHRPYFQTAIKLMSHEVFISRLDLNVERGEIEHPIRPVIRFATPVFNQNGLKQGILIFNFHAEKLLYLLNIHNRSNKGRLLLLNEQGYYLFSDKAEEAWGFQIAGRPSFSEHYHEWSEIKKLSAGSFLSQNGLFKHSMANQFNQVDKAWLNKYTPLASIKIFNEEKPWHIVSFVDKELLYAASNQRLRYAFVLISIILLLLVPVSLAWGKIRFCSEELIKRNRIYNQVVEQSDELIYITNTDGVIQYINPATMHYTGYQQEELIGKTPRIFNSGRQTTEFYDHLWNTIKDNRPFDGVFVNKRKDGSVFYESKTITPLHDSDGNIKHFVSTGRDISSNRGEYERDMDLTNRMAGGISHHFGNLIGVISLFSEFILMESGKEDSSTKNYINKIVATIDRVRKLLDRIRNVIKININPEYSVDLIKSLHSVVPQWVSEKERKINVLSKFNHDIPGIYCDSDSIVLALRSLLDNAYDVTDDNGSIEVGSRIISLENEVCVTCGEPLSGDFVELYVSDSGKGIPQDIQEKIWDPFYTNKESGNLVGITPGLGLSAVRSITHSNKGHILVSTSNEKGTTVSLLLPIEKKSTAD